MSGSTPTKENKPCLVLLFPEDQTDAPELEREVLKNQDCVVETVITAPALLARLEASPVNGMFCSVRNFDLPLLNILGKAQGLCQEMFTVVLSEGIEKRAKEYLKRLEKIVHLEKPMSIKAIALICEKLVQGSIVFERNHKRFPTDQPATLEIVRSQIILPGRVYNVSHGGAYLELDSGEVSLKEVVKLTIQLDKLGKERIVHAKVAWIMKQGFNTKKFGVGLEFIHSNEAYLDLLDRG